MSILRQEFKSGLDDLLQFLETPRSSPLRSSARAHFWIPGGPGQGHLIGEEISIPEPADVEALVSAHINSNQIAREFFSALSEKIPNGGGDNLGHEIFLRLFHAIYFKAISLRSIRWHFEHALIGYHANEFYHEYCSVICGTSRLFESIKLEENIELRPLEKGLLRYLTVKSFGTGGYWKRYDPLIEDQIVCIYKARKQGPVEFGNMKELLITNRVGLTLQLALRQNALVIGHQIAPWSLLNGVESGTSKQASVPLLSYLNEEEVLRIKRIWRLLDSFDLSWYRNQEDRLSIAVRRYVSSLAEPPAEACLALIIATETLLNPNRDTNELSFRYSLMAAVALSKNSDERKAIFDDFRSAYGFRSKTVHGANPEKLEKVLVERLKQHVSNLLIKAIYVFKNGNALRSWLDQIHNAGISGRFFD